jgi:hypothetical protein
MRNFDSRLTQSRNTNLAETAAPGCPAELSSAEAADKPDINKSAYNPEISSGCEQAPDSYQDMALAISQAHSTKLGFTVC